MSFYNEQRTFPRREMALTYEQLFDALRREKSRDELQKLEDGFYEEVAGFLQQKKRLMEQARQKHDLSSLSVQRAQIEYQNVQKILRDLYERRERKIVTLALHRTRTDAMIVDTDALLAQERVLYDELVRVLKESRTTVLQAAPSHERPAKVQEPEDEIAQESQARTHSDEPEEGLLEVHFTAAVPKFVGKNLQVFGPFQPGDAARLPPDVADILVRKGRAQRTAQVEP